MRRQDFKIEVCTNSVESVRAALAGGADRIELCAGMPEGGTTPSYGEICLVRELMPAGMHVIVRPRGGDFLYREDELEVMYRDIEMARKLGVDGVVLGCLTREGEVDEGVMSKLIQALETIEQLGCARILTSGQSNSAETGLPLLKELVSRARNVIIMPGCGVNAANVRKIAESTGAFEFHLSARIRLGSDMVYRNPAVSMGGTVQVDEYGREVSSSEKVEEVIRRLEY